MANLGRMVQLWFVKAEDDLRVSRALLDFESKHFEAIVFHSQQAAEKVIKGYLTHNKVRFGKTHDIAKLLELVKSVDPNLATKFQKAEILTKYAVAYRYPEEVEMPEPVTKAVAEAAVGLAQEVFDSFRISNSL